MSVCTIDTMEARIKELASRQDHAGLMYRHENGAVSLLFYDSDAESPRDYDTVATLVQLNNRYLTIDSDDEGVEEARSHYADYDPRYGGCRCHACRRNDPEPDTWWARRLHRAQNSRHTAEDMVRRWMRLFRPDIVAYETHADLGGGSGFAYVTASSCARHGVDPAEAERVMQAEIENYRLWANGEVYGVVVLTPTGPIVVTDIDGETVVGEAYEEDSCWGFLNYDDLRDPAAEVAGSPVTSPEWGE